MPPTPFSSLPVSTQTVMAYANCKFNITNIKNGLPVDCESAATIKATGRGVHGRIYTIPPNKGTFRNQLTAQIFIDDKIITAKIFPTGKFHLTGCKNLSHQRGAVVELMKHILSIHTVDKPTYSVENDEPINFILEVVMVNVDFNLGFDISQQKLDHLIQNDTTDFYSIYEAAVNTSVNIKLDYDDPEEKVYDKIVITGSPNDLTVNYTTVNKCPKSRTKATRTHTFLVFSSSKVIQSGRYYDSEMEPAYLKFYEYITNNRSQVELTLVNKTFDMSKLRGFLKNMSVKIFPSNDGKIHLGREVS